MFYKFSGGEVEEFLYFSGERLKSFYIFQGERLKSFYIFQGERLKSFYSCVSALLSIQLRDLLMRSITSYVQAFQDHRTLPR